LEGGSISFSVEAAEVDLAVAELLGVLVDSEVVMLT
jgi:hypothetical protein